MYQSIKKKNLIELVDRGWERPTRLSGGAVKGVNG
jgi:hypothetical protein